MYIKINNINYNRIKNISFSPETDITGSELPINQVSVDVITDDDIADPGKIIYMYDDLDNLWCKYWITFAERMDEQTFRIEGKSVLIRLDRRKLSAKMYNQEPAFDAITAIMSGFSASDYVIDSSFSTAKISGYAPEQSARERLQWVCFCIGAYVKTFFSEKIEILPIQETYKTIPLNKTYWKPSTEYDDYVTAVRIVSYSYREATPQTTDKWVQVGNTYYVQTSQEFTISNPDAPSTAEENIISIDSVTLINNSNVDDILNHLSKYYFKRIHVDLDAINNAEFEPGDKVRAYTDTESVIEGYIKSCSFTFGLQAKSRIEILQTDVVGGSKLVIRYFYGKEQIGKKTYLFPAGYEYEIENPYIDKTANKKRRIYRPINKTTSGTIPDSGSKEVKESYAIALELYKHVLKIVSVDELTIEERGSDDKKYNVVVIT